MASTEACAVIVETIDINAPIAVVFAALTEPEQLVQWWGDDDTYRSESFACDLRVGGQWSSRGTSRSGEVCAVVGEYRVIDAPHAIEFTWCHRWDTDHDRHVETLVRYDLTERDGLTRVSVTHRGFEELADRDDHAKGWKAVLGWLRAFVTAERASG